jgi:hypothetical protein
MAMRESGVWVRRSERRVHRRAQLDAPALLDARSSWQAGRCVDISAGGISVSIERPLPLGTVVELYFELPMGVSVETRGEVVRAGRQRMALRFVELAASTRHVIEAFTDRGARASQNPA